MHVCLLEVISLEGPCLLSAISLKELSLAVQPKPPAFHIISKHLEILWGTSHELGVLLDAKSAYQPYRHYKLWHFLFPQLINLPRLNYLNLTRLSLNLTLHPSDPSQVYLRRSFPLCCWFTLCSSLPMFLKTQIFNSSFAFPIVGGNFSLASD